MKSLSLWLVTLCAVWMELAVVPGGAAMADSGPPVILAQPESQSVKSGSSISFDVAADGSLPLFYQWRRDNTVLPNTTNATLAINNVAFTNAGNYQVVVSNSEGSVTSQVAVLTVDADLVFRILDLKTNGVVIVDEGQLTGYPRAGLAVSSNYVFATGGSSSAYNPRTARYAVGNLAGGTLLGSGLDALACDFRSGKVYTLANGSTPIGYTNNSLNFSRVNALLEIDETTGQPNGTQINLPLNIPISASGNVGIFSGYGRIVIHSSSGPRLYNIALPSGQLTDLGVVSTPSHVYSYSWAYWGIAEYAAGKLSLVYVQDPRTIARRVVTGNISTTTVASFLNLGTTATLGFSPSVSRWFFVTTYGSQFSSYDNALGSAKATYTTDPDFPVLTREPVGQKLPYGSTTTFAASAVGQDPLSYQWLFNGAALPNATNSTLTVSNAAVSEIGYYSLMVCNAHGCALSQRAYLDVVTSPRISSLSSSRSVLQGTNVTFSATVEGALPLSYQWWFNGTTPLPGATSTSLLLTNVHPSQSGSYTLLASNAFGTNLSSAIALSVLAVVDDGTVFQVTNLQANAQAIDVYSFLENYYECGPFAVSDNSVFFSSYYPSYRSARVNSSNLGNLGFLSRYYFALLSNLRTEKVYVLGTAGGVPTDPSTFTATTLWELDSTNGALGSAVALSQSIPNITSSDSVSFFSGYDEALVLNGSRGYKIALPSGLVTDCGPMANPSHPYSIGGSFWGILERVDGINYMLYAKDTASIARRRVPDGVETTPFVFENLSSYMNGISVSIPRGRWYFQHPLNSQFTPSGYRSSLGYASASFRLNSGPNADHFEWAPISPLQMAGVPFQVTVYAKNTDGRTVSNYNGTVYISGTSSNGATAVSVSPTVISNFVDGAWTGMVTVLQANPSMLLQADDLGGKKGKSGVFRAFPQNDLAISLTNSPTPVVVGQPLTTLIRVTNTGPQQVSGVLVTNFLTTNLVTFVSANASQGSCFFNGSQVICDLGTMSNFVEVIVVVTPIKTGLLSTRASLGRTGTDPDVSNNSLTVFTSIVQPILSVSNASATEGHSGTSEMVFTVSLNPPSTNTVSVNFSSSAPANGATASGAYQDFISKSGTVVFPPGTTNQTFTISILGDTLYEADEIFNVALTSPTNGSLGKSQATGTILNDDVPPAIDITDVHMVEGDSGTNNAVFTITLSSVTGVPATASYTTTDDTATAGRDYQAKSGPIAFAAETTNLVRTLSIPVMADTLPEYDESFSVILSGITNASAGKVIGVCTITNDDGVGTLDHFDCTPISSPQQVDAPFSVTLTAKDWFETTLSNFNRAVELKAVVPQPPREGSMFGDIQSTTSGTGGVYTIGFAFTPTNDLQVTHFRSYSGVKVSLWTDAGTLLAAQDVTSTVGSWANTPLSKPVPLAAGQTYRIGFYTGTGSDAIYYLGDIAETNFADGFIGTSYLATTEAFPSNVLTNDLGNMYFLVDLVYQAASTPLSIPLTPVTADKFVDGTWTGNATIQQLATNVTFEANDGAGHLGRSNPFNVLYFADLSLSASIPPDPFAPGTEATYYLTVANAGPSTATAVILSNGLPSGLTFVSSVTTAGQCTNDANGTLWCNLGDVSPDTQVTLKLTVRGEAAGSYQFSASLTGQQADPDESNNSITATLTVFQGPPSIVSPPESQSASSGAKVLFTAAAQGAEPLSYQWLFNSTTLPGATSATLVLANVNLLNSGLYSLRVSNAYGVVTSPAAFLAIDEDLTFRILELKTNNFVAIEVNNTTGDDRGGMAISSNSVFLTGDGQTGRWNKEGLTSGASLSTRYDSLVTDLRTEKAYTLATANNTPITSSGGTVASLVEIDSSGALTANTIALSKSIYASYNYDQVGLFSGYGRLVLHNGTNIYNVALPSGIVTDLGPANSLSHSYTESWAYWGLAEYAGGSLFMVYVQNNQTIVRTKVPNGAPSVLANFSSLSDMASFTFSPSMSRWFFHHEGTSQFRSGDETLGSAKATYTRDPGFPTLVQSPTDQTVYAETNVTFMAFATGAEPLTYQWYFNGKPLLDATNQTLALLDVAETNRGYYSVAAGNYIGVAMSGQAYLDVISSPRVLYMPSAASTFQGSNIWLYVSVDGAPPLTYQWWYNGTNLIPGATNVYLQLPNIQPSEAGYYSLALSNRFGTLRSSGIELFVSKLLDDGTMFQVTSLQATGARAVSTYAAFGSDNEYGPLAISSNSVFVSGYDTTVRGNAEDLSGLSNIGRLYYALLSNLRTEKVYALGDSNGVPTSFYSLTTATTLWEIDSTSGALGNRVYLSTPISNIAAGYSGVGFFSGYDRAVVLNGSRAYNIALPSGVVTDLGPMSTPPHSYSYGGAFWGVAEHFGGITYLVFARDYTRITRARVPDGEVSYPFQQFSNLGYYMNAISVSIRRGRWYFQHNWDSQFAPNNYSTLGYATATFAVNSGNNADHFDWAPVDSPQRSGTPFAATLYARSTSNSLVSTYSGTATVKGLSSPGGSAIVVAPTSVALTNGLWSGLITVLQSSTNMYLRAEDASGNAGLSGNFAVKPQNDLAVLMTAAPTPAVIGQPLTYSIRVTNTGPQQVSGVLATNFLTTNLVSFVSANTTQGSCSNVGAQVLCDLGAVDDFVDVTVVVTPIKTGLLSSRASIGRSGTDSDLSNNSITLFTSVVLPILSINAASAPEGDSGTNEMIFTVSLNPPSTNTVSVNFATATVAGGATSSGGYQDFVLRSGTLLFPPGTTNQTFSVSILGDTMFEANEIFNVNLTSPTNGSLGRNQATGTILNDDAPPILNVSDVRIAEGNSGTNNANFVFTLSAVTGVPLDAGYATSNGTAVAGSDYIAKSGVMTFAAETTNLVRTLSVFVLGDTNPEPNETFYLVLTGITNGVATRPFALCTITNEDGLEVLDHFTWSAMPAVQPPNVPFSATITAKDASDNTIPGFTGTVSLSGWTSVQTTNVILGDLVHSNSVTGADGTLGYAFTPTQDLRLTHFRHYFGTKVSLWTDAGTLIVSQTVISTPGQWVETPLNTPVLLTAGTRYCLAAYTGGGNAYWITNGVMSFADGVLHDGYDTAGDAFPTQADGIHWGFVDLRYTVGTNSPVSLTPLTSGSFAGGVWTGNITVSQEASGMFLQADDGAQHRGRSNPFNVATTLNADLGLSLTLTPAAVPTGSNVVYLASLTNHGPATATAITLTNVFPEALRFISATGTLWNWTINGQLLTASLPSLAPGESSTLTLVARAETPGIITTTLSIAQNDLNPTNNQAQVSLLVFTDTDHDGMPDDWEVLHNLNPNDSADAALDSDGDGVSNLQEFLAGTDPQSSNSVMRISYVRVSGSEVQLGFRGVQGKEYILDRAESVQGNPWSPIHSFKVGAMQDVELHDTVGSTNRMQLYRIRLAPTP